jgi:hypothetical protein
VVVDGRVKEIWRYLAPVSLNEHYAQLPLNGPYDNAYYLNILISASSGKSDRLMERIAPWSAAIAVHIVCVLFRFATRVVYKRLHARKIQATNL